MLRRTRQEIVGSIILLLALFILLSLVSYNPIEEPSLSPELSTHNLMGIFGVYISHYLIKMTVGWGTLVIPLIMGLLGFWIFTRRKLIPRLRHLFYLTGFGFWIGTALAIPSLWQGNLVFTHSGIVGGVLAKFLFEFTGNIGAIAILGLCLVLMVTNYLGWSIYDGWLWLYDHLGARYRSWQKSRQVPKSKSKPEKKETPPKERKRWFFKWQPTADPVLSPSEPALNEPEPICEPPEILVRDEPVPEPAYTPPEPEPSPRPEVKQAELPGVLPDQLSDEGLDEDIEIDEVAEVEEGNLDAVKGRRGRGRQYKLPSVDLLFQPPEIVHAVDEDSLVQRADQLRHALETFNVLGKVVHISPGPVITLFEIEPDEGVRVNKFTNLSDDLARIMKASRIRVIAPIPGKKTVGIELPNENPSTVYLRTIINSQKYIESESRLTIAIGKTTSGDAYIADLAKMPHLLIAGATGSGKSVCINTIIISILYKARPDEVKFIMIDPKKLELFTYKALVGYHLVTSPSIDEYVMTSPDNAVGILNAALMEMERRYTIIANATVRNINEYQAKAAEDDELENLPFIVVVIDELADLMITAGKNVEEPITRLAQMARAVGIHLVVATQRPSVDVITGLIKANFPARIAFQVAQKVDSRTILDQMGAEKLLGKGDMLFVPPTASEPLRLHNAFVSLEEIEAVMGHVGNQPAPDEVLLPEIRSEQGETDFVVEGDRDELLWDAAKLVIQHGQASVSLFQRRFRIGYSRAGRLIDELEKLGVVAGYSGSKAREVLVDESYLEMLIREE